MSDLSHWDFKEFFSGNEAAALILGLEPGGIGRYRQRIDVVAERMNADYLRAVERASFATIPFDELPNHELYPSSKQGYLVSEKLKSLCATAMGGNSEPFDKWFQYGSTNFHNQTFSRQTISEWMSAIGMTSVYAFYRGDSQSQSQPHASDGFIDPSDLPPELDAANLAFRAITKGFGDQSATRRNRLIQFLESNYPDFKPEQIKRIATVANPDKTTGRKKLDKE